MQVEVTSLAPAASAADRNGSTALTALTRPAFSAATMSGKGICTYFTDEAFTPSADSTALVVSVWMFSVRFTAIVLPARSDAFVMPDDGIAATP